MLYSQCHHFNNPPNVWGVFRLTDLVATWQYVCILFHFNDFTSFITVVVLTDPVENVTDTPSVEAQQNAVSFSLTGMTIDEVCCLPDEVII